MITQTKDGWTFTHGSRTYGPYPTRQAAQEALYDAERGAVPPVANTHGISPLPPAAIAAAQREMATPAHDWKRAPVEVGRTAAGLPIMGSFDVDGAPHIVEVETEYWSLNAGGWGDLTLLCKPDGGMIELSIDEEGLDVLRDLPRLLTGDTPERLLELAQQWDALCPPDPEPGPETTEAELETVTVDLDAIAAVTRDIDPFIRRVGFASGALAAIAMHSLDRDRAERLLSFLEQITAARGDALIAAVDRLIGAPAAAVRVERLVCNDEVDVEKFGKELGTDYECGNALFYVDDGGYLYLRAFGTEIDLALVERDIADLITLLSDPRVRSAIGSRMPLAQPAVRVEHLYCDPDKGDDLTREPRGAPAYAGYICGDEDTSAEVSFRLDGTWPPEVYMFGRDGVPLDQVERTLVNLITVLSDPRVRAARARYHELTTA